MTQTTIPYPIARRGVRTSKAAGDAIRASGHVAHQCEIVLRLVCANPGSTSRELSALYEDLCSFDGIKPLVTRWDISSRLSEMKDPKGGCRVYNGENRKCTISGREVMTWYANED